MPAYITTKVQKSKLNV